ncbi:MAG: citronellyl-CoA dehydrogenase [Cyanobacteria bacterium RYN_339]|nr:citronellyl-CoA dehydrogenase [Cyanobacteria bacterium RYN_339]
MPVPARSVYFCEDHAMFRETARKFMEQEVAPHADAWEAERRIPRAIWQRMGEMGFLGLVGPESHGGMDADVFFSIAFLEELPRSRMGGFTAAVTVHGFIATNAIRDHGTDDLKQRYLAPSITGEKLAAICISEPDAGSDVAALRTSAVRDGDHWVINGAKTWITNGVYADFHVVACKTDKDAGAGGISLIVVDTDTPGVSSSKLNKMGWHSSDTAEIAYENVRVPLGNLIGEENAGFRYIMQTFAFERLSAATTSIGSCDLALEETLAYMKTREAFGRPIAKFQALRHRLADMFTEVEAARQLCYHTAWLHQNGVPAVKESSQAKLLASELSKRVADECLQFFGGFGFVEEYPMARFYRDARVGTIVAGTSEIMREIIAKVEVDGVDFGRPREKKVHQAPAAPAPVAQAAEVAPNTVPELFLSLPTRLRPEKTEGLRTRVHFQFPGSAWTVEIDGPLCQVQEGLHGEPACVVQSTEEVYLDLEAGRESPEMAFMTGKVKISNPLVMQQFARSFRRIAR